MDDRARRFREGDWRLWLGVLKEPAPKRMNGTPSPASDQAMRFINNGALLSRAFGVLRGGLTSVLELPDDSQIVAEVMRRSMAALHQTGDDGARPALELLEELIHDMNADERWSEDQRRF